MKKNGYSVRFYALEKGKVECVGILRPYDGKMSAGLHRSIIATLLCETEAAVWAVTDGGTTYTSHKTRLASGVTVLHYAINGKIMPKKLHR